LLKPLSADLAELRLARPRELLLLTNRRGAQWTSTTFSNWRRRVFQQVAPGMRPYHLRHTFVSLLIAEGRTVPDVAKQAGHGSEVCLRTYAHLWDEFEVPDSAEDAIRVARRSVAGAVESALEPVDNALGGA
jgi:integrase